MNCTRLYQWVYGDRLPRGPFSGTRYIRACIGSAIWPKLLGTYEMELGPAVEDLIRWQPDLIVNAGAAEGYYAVGLARRCPTSRIAAYETSPEGRKLLQLLAARNNAGDRIKVEGELTTRCLHQELSGARRPALVLDVEGAELELLDFDACPSLKNTFVILETHPCKGGSTCGEMRRRFAATHEIEEIPVAPRVLGDLPKGMQLLAKCGFGEGILKLLEEGRGAAPPWLKLTPRRGA